VLKSSLAFAFGILVMIAAAPGSGQDRKEPEPLKAPYTERVTYRYWNISDRHFINPRTVDAFHKEKDGKVTYQLGRRNAGSSLPSVGSEIIDEAGAVWMVTKAVNGSERFITYVVLKKAAPKQKD
jgi:hypothetical protein